MNEAESEAVYSSVCCGFGWYGLVLTDEQTVVDTEPGVESQREII